MMSWLYRARSGKDYEGRGGYLVGARILPEHCLVDLNHPDLPEFGFSQHGNEEEIIVLPNVALVAKVYDVIGDIEREVEEFQKSWENKTPHHDHFFSYIFPVTVEEVRGDSESGEVEFSMVQDPYALKGDAGKTPQQVLHERDIESTFRRRMYDIEWVSDTTLRYQRMSLPGKVATRFLNRNDW